MSKSKGTRRAISQWIDDHEIVGKKLTPAYESDGGEKGYHLREVFMTTNDLTDFVQTFSVWIHSDGVLHID